ncbi:MAG: ACT domain-containing protein [candidate division Zixibacteria bacterium]|nr:ACT domain-containing protein [candidate division Zixibacteria bacterium]
MSQFDVTSRTDVAKVTLNSAPDRPGIGAQIFGALWSYDINVELVSSAPAPEGKADVTLVVGKDHLNPAILKLQKIKEELDAKDLTVDQDVAIVTVNHPQLSRTPGIAAKIFSLLSQADINVEAISSSTTSIACVIREKEGQKAVEALQEGLEV